MGIALWQLGYCLHLLAMIIWNFIDCSHYYLYPPRADHQSTYFFIEWRHFVNLSCAMDFIAGFDLFSFGRSEYSTSFTCHHLLVYWHLVLPDEMATAEFSCHFANDWYQIHPPTLRLHVSNCYYSTLGYWIAHFLRQEEQSQSLICRQDAQPLDTAAYARRRCMRGTLHCRLRIFSFCLDTQSFYAPKGFLHFLESSRNISHISYSIYWHWHLRNHLTELQARHQYLNPSNALTLRNSPN